MKNLSSDKLSININADGGKVLMTWLGQSDSRNPSTALNPYFESLINDLKACELTIRFDDLEYMNSSTVPPIIKFLKTLNNNEITTIITYDTEKKWQAASFKALETFSGMLNYITVKGSL